MLSIGLVTPIFFQLKGAIFADKMTNYDGNGDLLTTPLPLSIIVCLVGILLLANTRQARLPIAIVILSITFMLISLVVSALWAGQPLAISKFVLLAQFAVPMLGLILGFSWQDSRTTQKETPIFEATALLVLALIMPTQILFTFIQEVHPLTPWMYFFSIYQHLQYVPVILVGLFWWVCIDLFNHRWARRLSISLVFVVSCYAMLAMSIQAVLLCTIGAIGLVWLHGANRQTLLGLCLMVAGLFFALQLDGGGFKFISSIKRNEPSNVGTMHWSDKLGTSNRVQSNETNEPAAEAKKTTLPGLHQRFALVQLYISRLIDNPRWLVFGRPSPIERHVAPSAHNYFLDFLTNFGLLGIVPAIALILITIYKVFKPKNAQTSFTYGSLSLVGVLFFWVIFHNFLTVALRQPFPGILIFFVWGLLISRLNDKDFAASGKVIAPQKI